MQYILQGGKIDTQSVMAATHLIAQRGRENGFWKDILAELQRDKPHTEIGCVRLLGKMLETDAAARDAMRRQQEGELSAWMPTVALGPEVVAELIDRGRKADRFRIDHYTIALARARAPESRSFFQSILRNRTDTANTLATAPLSWVHTDSTRFHAAVGLAQLGDSEGVAWLIEHCEYSQGSVMNAWPQGAPPGGSLDACCVHALRQLTGERERTTQAEWAARWNVVDKTLLVGRTVVLGDP